MQKLPDNMKISTFTVMSECHIHVTYIKHILQALTIMKHIYRLQAGI